MRNENPTQEESNHYLWLRFSKFSLKQVGILNFQHSSQNALLLLRWEMEEFLLRKENIFLFFLRGKYFQLYPHQFLWLVKYFHYISQKESGLKYKTKGIWNGFLVRKVSQQLSFWTQEKHTRSWLARKATSQEGWLFFSLKAWKGSPSLFIDYTVLVSCNHRVWFGWVFLLSRLLPSQYLSFQKFPWVIK